METLLYFQSTATTSALGKLDGVCHAARERGWWVNRFDLHRPDQIRDEIRYWHPIGCIIECAACDFPLPLRTLRHVPTVLLDCDTALTRKSISTLAQDPSATGRLAADFLMETDLPAYAYVGWSESKFWDRMRKKAFETRIRRSGKRFFHVSPRIRTDADDLRASLSNWLSGLPRPIGIYCVNDCMATQILAAATASGMSVPDDFVILGTDNETYLCENSTPTLSSVAIDFFHAGMRSVEIIADLTAGRIVEPIHEHFGPSKIIERSSTRISAKPDKRVIEALDLICGNAIHGLTAHDVAKTFNCSRRMAEIRFRAMTGHSIVDEIHSVQVEHAQQLLSNPTNKLTMIPSMCGYDSNPFFMKLFRRQTGMSMGEWRRQQIRKTAVTASRKAARRCCALTRGS